MDNDNGVTVIVSTHNRPNALKYCLQSIIYQTYKDWIIYVIGDDCDDRTEMVIKEINNPKIKYYNNPIRFGEQSGCNNIGILFTRSKYIAFMNHDDIWIFDHLEKAVHYLEDAEFYIGRTIYSYKSDDEIPELKLVSSRFRKIYWSFYKPYTIFEPCSSWVLRTDCISRVGPWRQSIEMHRTSINDFIMRAWRKRIKFYFGDEITCIKTGYHQNVKTNQYEYDYEGMEMFNLLEHFEKTAFKKELLFDEKKLIPFNPQIKIFFNGKVKLQSLIYILLFNRITGLLYYYFNFDFFDFLNTFLLKQKGGGMISGVRRRTGEFIVTKESFHRAIKLAIDNNVF